MDDKKQKDYKKPTLLLLLVAAGALVTVCAAFSLRQEAAVPAQAGTTQNDMSYYTPKPAASQESPAAAQPEQDGPYRVALYEGKVGVFQLGAAEPFLTADVDVYLLPEEDIALLRKGLTAQRLPAVKSILEDYEKVTPAPCRGPGRALAGGKLIYFMPFS